MQAHEVERYLCAASDLNDASLRELKTMDPELARRGAACVVRSIYTDYRTGGGTAMHHHHTIEKNI